MEIGSGSHFYGLFPGHHYFVEATRRPPCSHQSVTYGMFLHHLLRLLVQYGEPSLSRHQFVESFRRYFGENGTVPKAIDVRKSFAVDLLANLCRRHGLEVHRRSNYPMQPRPFDLTPRDLPRLVDCLVTPVQSKH